MKLKSMALYRLNRYFTTHIAMEAANLFNFLDPNVDPCEDFYMYACGGWIKKNPLPDQKEEWNQFTKLEEESSQFVRAILHSKETQAEYSRLSSFMKGIAYFKSCLDTKEQNRRGTKPLDDLIKEYGSWTLTTDDWKEESWDMIKYLALMRRKLSLGPLFTVFVGADPRKSSVNIIQIRPLALLGISQHRLTSNTTYGIKGRKIYQEFTLNLTKALGAKNDSLPEILNIIDFEIKLAQIMPSASQAYDDENMYRKLTVKELDQYAGSNWMKWKVFFEQLLLPVTGKHVTEEEHVVVYGVDYLKNITNLLDGTPNRTIANYMVWRLVDSVYLRLGDEFEEILENFFITLEGYWIPISRDELCVQLMREKYFAAPLSRIYVDSLFNGNSKKVAKELVDDIREAFEQNILELDWMDEKTKSLAIQKAKMMAENIGFPDYIVDDKLLDEEYKNVNCNQSTYFENELSLDQAITERDLAYFGKLVDETRWALSPISINAYYDMLANKMVFPAAILQSPFYNKRYPRAVLYGGVGGIMGHELTHGYDVDGRRFDMKGDERNWWSEETLKAFNRKTECLKDQYSNFTFHGGTVGSSVGVVELEEDKSLSEYCQDTGEI
ncbi:Endothelin-converting enzyme 2 [Stylophora pistillata]|uniref:Endothelin-converting enzyme 2 n=1 Tax=Stylophora pistillata TaxID=50429 RepID=A0A2B4SMJ3_STYPI|nr:Endothelin-converting enzyme 2 [Stylophora pistillata]